MPPVNSSKNSGCGSPTTTECVFWQGPNIECLGIERGQKISESVELVANEVCALKDMLNLTDLELKCVFDLCISCPEPEKTLKVVLQLIINKICSIQDIIDTISGSNSDNSDPLVRLASCFQYTNDSGDLVVELPHTEYTRRIANQVCSILLTLSSLEDDVQNLNDKVNDLQNQINNLDTNIPDVSSDCLFTGTRAINEAYDLLDQAFCQVRSGVGTSTQINQSISQQCENLNAEFSSEPGWNLNPQNLAQTIQNIWIVLCKRSSEIKSIQDTCCAISCDDVKIGFTVVLNDERNEATIRFTAGAGTNLPSGFSDIGSRITITDKTGNSMDYEITVENNGEDILDLAGLNTNEEYTFSLEAKVSNGSLTCQKCITRIATVQNTCSYCEITNIGTTGEIIIIYE